MLNVNVPSQVAVGHQLRVSPAAGLQRPGQCRQRRQRQHQDTQDRQDSQDSGQEERALHPHVEPRDLLQKVFPFYFIE